MIENVPVEELIVDRKPVPETKIDEEAVHKALSSGKDVWRSSRALADSLNVDVVALDKHLSSCTDVCCRPSKRDTGVFLYALLRRLPQEEESKPTRSLVDEADYYALALLQGVAVTYEMILQKYAMKIASRNPEAFTQLMQGKDKIEAGIVMYGARIKADMGKLPKV